jgi:membrane protease YdiL (CAAX protease family)
MTAPTSPGSDDRTQGWIRAEVLIVLGISLGQSAIYSILSIADRLTQQKALNQQSSQLNTSVTPDRPWLDLSYQLVDIAFPLVPVVLVLYLLWLHNPAGSRHPGRLIGFDLRRPGFDIGLGALTALCIGVPGLGLYLGARALGLNTQVQASNLADNWWTIPVLVLSAAENAILEEVIMLGFLYTRLRQLTWRGANLAWPVIIIVSALIRGSYHLYQGFGGFAGNLIMGVIFGLIYLKWKRVMPLVVTHTLLDISAFVGYSLLAPHVSWL